MSDMTWHDEYQRRLRVLMEQRLGKAPREGTIEVSVEGWTHKYSSWTEESGTTVELSDGWTNVTWDGDLGSLMRALGDLEPAPTLDEPPVEPAPWNPRPMGRGYVW